MAKKKGKKVSIDKERRNKLVCIINKECGWHYMANLTCYRLDFFHSMACMFRDILRNAQSGSVSNIKVAIPCFKEEDVDDRQILKEYRKHIDAFACESHTDNCSIKFTIPMEYIQESYESLCTKLRNFWGSFLSDNSEKATDLKKFSPWDMNVIEIAKAKDSAAFTKAESDIALFISAINRVRSRFYKQVSSPRFPTRYEFVKAAEEVKISGSTTNRYVLAGYKALHALEPYKEFITIPELQVIIKEVDLRKILFKITNMRGINDTVVAASTISTTINNINKILALFSTGDPKTMFWVETRREKGYLLGIKENDDPKAQAQTDDGVEDKRRPLNDEVAGDFY